MVVSVEILRIGYRRILVFLLIVNIRISGAISVVYFGEATVTSGDGPFIPSRIELTLPRKGPSPKRRVARLHLSAVHNGGAAVRIRDVHALVVLSQVLRYLILGCSQHLAHFFLVDEADGLDDVDQEDAQDYRQQGLAVLGEGLEYNEGRCRSHFFVDGYDDEHDAVD